MDNTVDTDMTQSGSLVSDIDLHSFRDAKDGLLKSFTKDQIFTLMSGGRAAG